MLVGRKSKSVFGYSCRGFTKKGNEKDRSAVSRAIATLTRRQQERIDQLTTLFENDGGPEVIELALQVIGEGFGAADWLTSGQLGLNWAIPAVVALSLEGRDAVITYLKQIEYGVYV